MKPSLLDPRFKYVPSASTNIAATFKRIRKQQQLEREQEQAIIRISKVRALR